MVNIKEVDQISNMVSSMIKSGQNFALDPVTLNWIDDQHPDIEYSLLIKSRVFTNYNDTHNRPLFN